MFDLSWTVGLVSCRLLLATATATPTQPAGVIVWIELGE
jgi:hypothetical protein